MEAMGGAGVERVEAGVACCPDATTQTARWEQEDSRRRSESPPGKGESTRRTDNAQSLRDWPRGSR
eukprot:3502907-Pyramimonas_sp.AAC.1